MKTKNLFQKISRFGVVFAVSLTLFAGNVGLAHPYTAKVSAATTEVKISKEAGKTFKDIEKLINKKEIKKNFENLVETPRVRGTKENKAAGKYIFDTVKKYGYDVKFQNFTGYDEKFTDIHGNTNKNQKKGKVLFKGRNIIVKRNNPDPKLKTVIFSAKYDSNKGSIGALDNAGGTAALMEMTRVLADMKLSYNPEFVFFDSENLRRGSRHYIASLSKEDKEKIYGAVNINSIGNKKQRKQMFFASKKDKSRLKKQCEKNFPGIVSNKSTETDAYTFIAEEIPSLCYFTYDVFGSSKEIKIEDYVSEKDASLVDMDTLVYDTAFITTYASMLKADTVKSGKQNKTYKFVKDVSLDKYIDKKLQDKVLKSEPAADTPTTYFVNNKYVGVLCRKGILIFDKNNGKLNTVIDIAGLGFDRTQGDYAILDKTDNDYLVLYKAGETKGYVYSFNESALAEIDDISKLNPSRSVDRALETDEYNKLLQAIGGCVGAYKCGKNYVALVPDYDNIKNSLVYVVDEKFNVIMKFAIGAK